MDCGYIPTLFTEFKSQLGRREGCMHHGAIADKFAISGAQSLRKPGTKAQSSGSRSALASLPRTSTLDRTSEKDVFAPIAQLDRASVYETEGYWFESSWVYCCRLQPRRL